MSSVVVTLSTVQGFRNYILYPRNVEGVAHCLFSMGVMDRHGQWVRVFTGVGFRGGKGSGGEVNDLQRI